MSAEQPTAAERIAAALAKREQLKTSEADARAEQYAVDLEALVDLEGEHGFDRIVRVDVGVWQPGKGAATMVVAKAPRGSEKVFKRFEEKIAKAKKDGSTAVLDAHHELAISCLVYPSDKKLLDATLDIAPGLLSHVANEIVKAVQGSAEDEKKG